MTKNNRIFSVICLGICVGLLLVGLWPMDFFPENEVRWLADRNGLNFHGSRNRLKLSAGGVALSSTPLDPPRKGLTRKGSFSIEIWLRPSAEPTRYRNRIVVFCDDFKGETLFVGQWKSLLLVRWLVSGSGSLKRYREIGMDKALRAGKTRFVSITSCEKGTTIYLEGKRVERFPKVRLIDRNGSVSGRRIIIGNSPEGTRSWAGDLFGLAVYERSLTEEEALQSFQWWTGGKYAPSHDQDGLIALYTFTEGFGTRVHSTVGSGNCLLIPSLLQFEKEILIPPKTPPNLRSSDIQDTVLNIIGFIPFGFFLSLWLHKTRKWAPSNGHFVAIVLGGLVSLTIEVAQGYLPTRDSSQADLICNTLGTIFGVILFHRFHSTKSKRSVRLV